MLIPAKRLKEQLAARQTLVGVMATDHIWPLLVELCQAAGIDYLVLDREHGPHSDESVAHFCQTARLANFPVLMRTASTESAELRRAVDLGPCGLVLPCVEDSQTLNAVQDSVFMPPRGKRRPGGMGNYWMKDFQYSTWRADFEEHFIVIPQIESQAGVDAADEIAAHPLTTAMGLGPYDLAADLGCCWDPENEAHREAIRRVRTAAERVDKRLWIGCDAEKLRREGDTFLWIGSISGVLINVLRDRVDRIRACGDTPTG